MALMPLLFIHIPKTAGKTLDYALRRMVHRHARLNLRVEAEDLARIPAQERAALQVISGHFTYDQAKADLEPLLTGRIRYISVIRHPVDRLRSVYAYIRAKYGASGKLRVGYHDDINVVAERWLDSPDEFRSYANLQCYYLSGKGTAAAALSAIESDYLAVSATDDVNDFCAQFALGMGKQFAERNRINPSNSADFTFDPGIVKRLEQRHAEDMALYDHVRSRAGHFRRRLVDAAA
jgi:hypothetical protein